MPWHCELISQVRPGHLFNYFLLIEMSIHNTCKWNNMLNNIWNIEYFILRALNTSSLTLENEERARTASRNSRPNMDFKWMFNFVFWHAYKVLFPPALQGKTFQRYCGFVREKHIVKFLPGSLPLLCLLQTQQLVLVPGHRTQSVTEITSTCQYGSFFHYSVSKQINKNK